MVRRATIPFQKTRKTAFLSEANEILDQMIDSDLDDSSGHGDSRDVVTLRKHPGNVRYRGFRFYITRKPEGVVSIRKLGPAPSLF